jgi:hypothetical protein
LSALSVPAAFVPPHGMVPRTTLAQVRRTGVSLRKASGVRGSLSGLRAIAFR